MVKNTIRTWCMVLAAAAALLAISPAGAQVAVDPGLPDYKAAEGVTGTIKSVGSDTVLNLMTEWSTAFTQIYPNVSKEIEGKGSATAPPALIAGTSNFGPMSRMMKDTEIDGFEQKFGYKPAKLSVAIDMLAVYVNKDNPIKGLAFPQVDAIFSKTRKLGFPEAINSWGQLGMTGEWANRTISLYGRNSASGTYGYFKEHALGDGDYRDEVKEQPGSSSVVQGVASDMGAIGYSGIGYKTADVRAIPLAKETGGEFVPAEPEKAYSGEYPLARFLYIYINLKPGEELDPLRREFIKYIFSKQGQEAVLKEGYLPISAKVAKDSLVAAGIEKKM